MLCVQLDGMHITSQAWLDCTLSPVDTVFELRIKEGLPFVWRKAFLSSPIME